MSRTNLGFFGTVFERLVAAREKQVARYVNQALLGLDDATLQTQGYSREELKRRAKAYYPL